MTRNFKPITPVDVSDDDLTAFAARRGIPTIAPVENETKPAKELATRPKQQPKVAPTTEETNGPTARIGLEAPQYLADELKRRALDDRCSVRYVLLRALREAGFTVHEKDLVSDGRRIR